MKLKLIALSLVLSAASSSAFAALDGGQLNFAGLVSDNTCTPHVNGGSQDGQVHLIPQFLPILQLVFQRQRLVCSRNLSISPSTVVLIQQTRVQS